MLEMNMGRQLCSTLYMSVDGATPTLNRGGF